jgi:hypothetical protein
MTLFQDFYRSPLLPTSPDGALGDRQRLLDAHFAATVLQAPFRLWSPGDPIPQQGNRLLIGVATWSASDMTLLDAVSQALQERTPTLVVEVFNVANCRSVEAFSRYVPGIGSVFHTPVGGSLESRDARAKSNRQTRS